MKRHVKLDEAYSFSKAWGNKKIDLEFEIPLRIHYDLRPMGDDGVLRVLKHNRIVEEYEKLKNKKGFITFLNKKFQK